MNAWLVSGEAAWRLAGWTMLHFLWVGAIVALVGGVVRVACRRAGPGVRYGVSLLTLVGVAAAPVGIAIWLAQQAPQVASSNPTIQPRALPRVIDLAQTPIVVGQNAQGGDALRSPSPWDEQTTALRSVATGDRARLLPSLERQEIFEAVASSLPWIWLGGAPATFALLATGLVGSRRLRRQCAVVTEGAALELLERIKKLVRVTRRVALAACDGVAQPVLVGIVRPTILLPAAALTGWSPEELEMVLVHELAHVRRWDNLVNLVQRLVESALFFHPAVWLASRQVRRDREECCDAAVVGYTRRPVEYAELLVAIAGRRARARTRLAEASLAWGSAMADHPLAGRIRRILKLEDEPMWVSRSTLGLAIVLSASLLAAVVALPPTSGAVADDASTPPSVAAATDGGEEEAQNTVRAGVPRAAQNQLKAADGWFANDLQSTNTAAGGGEAPARAAYQNFEEYELPKLKNDIALYQSQLIQLQKEQEDIEALKDKALQDARSPAALEAAVEAEIRKDPTIAKYQQQLFKVEQDIQQQRAAGRRDPNSPRRQELMARKNQIEAKLTQYKERAEKAARERLAKVPNEALRSAMAEYTIRSKSIADRKAQLEEKLKAAEARIAEMDAGAEEASVRSADRYQSTAATYADASRANFAVTQAQEEFRTYRAALMALDREAEDLEVRKQLAERQAQLAANVDAQVEEQLERDRRAKIFEEEAISLEQQLRALKGAAGEESQQRYQQVLVQYEELEKQAEQYRAEAMSKYRDRLEKAAQAAREMAQVEYEVHAKALDRRRADLTEKLAEVEKQLEELNKNAAATWQEIPKSFYYDYSRQPGTPGTSSSPAAAGEPVNQPYPQLKDPWDNPGTTAAPASPAAAPRPAAQPQVGEPIPFPDASSPTPTPLRDAYAAPLQPATQLPTDNTYPAPTQAVAPTTPFAVIQPLAPAAKRTLQAGDAVRVQAAGVDPANPLGDEFRVEAEGTLPLGPLYGRVKVAGLTALEAQEAIELHLKKMFKDPHVQVVLAAPADVLVLNPLSQLSQPGPETRLLYDGRTFDEWSRSWQNELKTDKRSAAIEALAAFGRAGMADEAVEAILEVAGQYDFYTIDNQNSEGQLKQQVIQLLTSTSASRLRESAWLPALVRRLEADPVKWKWLAWQLLTNLTTEDAAVREKLFALAQSQDDNIQEAAMWALANSDPTRTNAKVMEGVLRLVRSKDAEEVKTGINMLISSPKMPGGQRFAPAKLRQAAEVVPHLFHSDESVQQTAREALTCVGRDEAPAIVADLLKRLKEPEDEATKVAAIRALAALGPNAAAGEPALQDAIVSGERNVAIAAAAAIDRMHPGASPSPGSQALINYLTGSPETAMSYDDQMIERERASLFLPRDDYRGGGFGGGGGRGGF